MEQDYRCIRCIKQRYYPMRGVGSFGAVVRFCSAHDGLSDHFRFRRRLDETVPFMDQ